MERAYNLTARQWESWMDRAYRPSYNVAPSRLSYEFCPALEVARIMEVGPLPRPPQCVLIISDLNPTGDGHTSIAQL